MRRLLLAAMLVARPLFGQAQPVSRTAQPINGSGLGSSSVSLSPSSPQTGSISVTGSVTAGGGFGWPLAAPTGLTVNAVTGGSNTISAQTRCYVITTVDLSGFESPLSNEACATLGSAGHFDLAWNSTISGTGFFVYYGTVSGTYTKLTYDVNSAASWNATSYTDNSISSWSDASAVPNAPGGTRYALGPTVSGAYPLQVLNENGGFYIGNSFGRVNLVAQPSAALVLSADSQSTDHVRIETSGAVKINSLKTTGSATGKKVVCVDTATGQLYASSTGTDCSN